MTQQQLSDLSGVSRETIAKIEIGEIRQPREIESLARALYVSPAWLQFGAEEIDSLSPQTSDVARTLQSLPESERAAMIVAIQCLAKSH